MPKRDTVFKRKITVLSEIEARALEDSAEQDIRGESDQARYLIVEGLRRRNLLENHSEGNGEEQEDD